MLKIGKLDNEVLDKIVIDKISYKRPEVKTRSGIGEDCAVIDYGQYDCVISTDPITASIKDIGRLSIHISCNDIASNGIEPLGVTLAVMLPPGTEEAEVEEIMDQAAKAAELIGVEIVGGHTEVTPAVNQPIIVSTAFGRTPSGGSQKAADMKVGDFVLMTKSAGLEGTGIIASERSEEIGNFMAQSEIEECQGMLDSVSVVKEGIIAGRIGTSGMHDVTEGGVFGAVWEMCQISKLGCILEEKSIPISNATEKLCSHFGINPLRLISSGSMVIIVSPSKKDEVIEKLTESDVPVSVIGRIRGKEEGIKCLCSNGNVEDIAPPETDELYKIIVR